MKFASTRLALASLVFAVIGLSFARAQTGSDGGVPIRIWATAKSAPLAGSYYTITDVGYVGNSTFYPPQAISWPEGYYYTEYAFRGPAQFWAYGRYFNISSPYVYWYYTSWQAPYPAQVELSANLLSGNAYGAGRIVSPNQDFSAAVPGVVRVEMGKSYTLNVSYSLIVSGAINVSAPPQCRVVLNGMERNRCGISSTVVLTILPGNPMPHGAAGFASSLAPDRLEWSVPLGTLRNGDDAGSLRLVNPGTGADWNALFAPSALNCESTSDEVLVYRVGYAIRQVIANQVAIDVVVPPGAASYELRCYNPQQLQNTTPPCTFSGQPFVTYVVKKSDDVGDPSTALKIVREFRNITDPVATNHPVARTETTKLMRSGTAGNFSWTKQDWHAGPQVIQETVASIAAYGTTRTEQIALRTPGGQTALAATRTYTAFSFGESLASEVVGTTDSRSVSFGYHNDPNQPGSLGFIESVRLPGGGWEAYDYHDATQAMSYQGGRVKYRYRPYGAAASATPTRDPTQGEVVYSEYGPDPFGFNTRPTLIRTTVNGTETGRTTISYSSTDANVAITATRSDYSSSTAAPLVTTTVYCSENCSDAFYRGKPLSVRRPDGVMKNYTYEKGSWNGTNFVVGGSPATASKITVATLQGVGFALDRVSTKEVTIRDARALVVRTELYVSSNNIWELVSATNYTYNLAGLLVGRTSANGATYSAVWDGNFKIRETDEKGVVTSYEPDAAGRILTATRGGASGEGTTIAELATRYSYDAANHVLEQRVGAAGAENLVTTSGYDDAGRIVSEAAPGIGATTHRYNVSGRQHITTRPDGSTVIETQNLDGTLASRTGTGVVQQYFAYGVEWYGRRWTRVDTAERSSLRWTKTWTDWLGRKVITRRPAFGASQVNYDAPVIDETSSYNPTTGQIDRTTRPGVAPTLYGYNSISQLVRSGSDIDGSMALVPQSSDRITDVSEVFEYFDGAWWSSKTESTYPYDGASAGTAVQTTKTSQRLSALGDINASGQLREETRSWDIFNNETRRTVRVDPATRMVTVTTTRAGTTLMQVEKSLAGLPISITSFEGITTKKTYDALARPVSVIDPRTGATTTTYHPNSTLVKEVKDSALKRLSFTQYDTSGRPIYSETAHPTSSTQPGYTTRTSYTLRGEVSQVWGSGTYPVSYEYNEFGERTKMRTYQDPGNSAVSDSTAFPTLGNGNETTWEFDAATGLLKKKYDAKVQFVEYDYDNAGRLWHRYWARTLPGSTTRLTTTYTYDPATGDQTAIGYNDGTPGVLYGYNRLGQNISVVQSYSGSSVQTLLDRCLCGKISTEYFDAGFFDGRSLTHFTNSNADGFKGRSTGYALISGSTVEQSTAYGYEATTGRFSTLATNAGGLSALTHTFNYGYVANSNLISALSVDTGHPFTITRSFEPNRDLLTSIEARWSTASRTKYAYTYDDRGQRATVVQAGDVFADYGGPSNGAIHQNFAYNGRGELVQAATWLGDLAAGEPDSGFMSARKHEFAYDGIGNRRYANTGGVDGTRDNYTVNELNQYVGRENNTLSVGGTVANDAGIKVVAGSNAVGAAGRHGRHWGDNMLLDNLAGPYLGPVKFFAGKAGGAGGADLLKTVERSAFLPPAWQTFTYDADGNLLSDGVWNYTWDAENRLVAMETKPEAIGPIPSAEARRLEFKYDYLNRRIENLVRSGWNGSAYGTVLSQRRFIYDGWNLIAEFSLSSQLSTLSLVRTYTWGLDIARTMSDAGGVGALLQVADHSLNKAYLPSYDGNGNIAALFDAGSTGGTCVAAYEYSPYGEFLRSEGTYARENPFRFSTKFTDDETGLVYYGRRFYSPSQGRFLGRDPKEEKGGMHLYAFVGNNPTNKWDLLGMEAMATYVVNGGRRETRREEDGNGCLWDVTYQDMSADPAYGIEDMREVERVKISCPDDQRKKLCDSIFSSIASVANTYGEFQKRVTAYRSVKQLFDSANARDIKTASFQFLDSLSDLIIDAIKSAAPFGLAKDLAVTVPMSIVGAVGGTNTSETIGSIADGTAAAAKSSLTIAAVSFDKAVGPFVGRAALAGTIGVTLIKGGEAYAPVILSVGDQKKILDHFVPNYTEASVAESGKRFMDQLDHFTNLSQTNNCSDF